MNPYESPSAKTEAFQQELQHGAVIKVGAVVALILLTGFLLGGVGTVIGMTKAFSTLSESGEVDPSVLANDISFAILSTLWGFLINILGVVLVLIYHFKVKFYHKWFYWSVITLSVLMTLSFPLGTIIGVPLLIIFVKGRALYLRVT